MKKRLLRGLFVAGALLSALVVTGRAQIIEYRATINAAQEGSNVTSNGTGIAVMLYDVGTNTFDLWITINNLTNTVTASHIHEGAVGVAGPVTHGLGAEAVYTRSANQLFGVFRNQVYAGNRLNLLQNKAYYNLHTAAYPAGEVRGQLIAQPVRLSANITVAQENNPAIVSNAFGGAIIDYNPGTNIINTRVSLYNFSNTISASHYHEGAIGVAGPVVQNLGGAAVYTRIGNSLNAVFKDIVYSGDPVKLLTGGAYLNFHSTTYTGGETRGQVNISEDTTSGRLINISTRGQAGTGAQALTTGFVVGGTDPVRVLITALGPKLNAIGIAGSLANPQLSVYDSAGRVMISNDDYATTFGANEFPAITVAPTFALESAVLVVLPPGAYTMITTGVNNTTGIAINEVYELRPSQSGSLVGTIKAERARAIAAMSGTPKPASTAAAANNGVPAMPEFCSTPAASTVASVK